MAEVTYRDKMNHEVVTATGSAALLVLPEGVEGHRVYYDDMDQGSWQLVRMGAIVIAMLRDMKLLEGAMLLSEMNQETAEFRFGGEIVKPNG